MRIETARIAPCGGTRPILARILTSVQSGEREAELLCICRVPPWRARQREACRQDGIHTSQGHPRSSTSPPLGTHPTPTALHLCARGGFERPTPLALASADARARAVRARARAVRPRRKPALSSAPWARARDQWRRHNASVATAPTARLREARERGPRRSRGCGGNGIGGVRAPGRARARAAGGRDVNGMRARGYNAATAAERQGGGVRVQAKLRTEVSALRRMLARQGRGNTCRRKNERPHVLRHTDMLCEFGIKNRLQRLGSCGLHGPIAAYRVVLLGICIARTTKSWYRGGADEANRKSCLVLDISGPLEIAEGSTSGGED